MAEETKRGGALGRGPIFWGAMMFLSYAGIAALGLTGALEAPALLILMLVPTVLMIPLFKSASRRVEQGGAECIGKGEAQKRYLKRVMVSTSIYLVAMGAMVFVQNAQQVDYVWQVITAIPPGLAVIGIFWAIGRLIVEEQDEFIRMLVIRQSLIASTVALSAAAIWGFLESAAVVPHADAYWWPVLWFVGLAIGAVANRIEYGAWGAV